MKDGRVKGAKRARTQASEEQKFNKEWQQIQQIMKKREPKTQPQEGGREIQMSSKRQKILLKNQR